MDTPRKFDPELPADPEIVDPTVPVAPKPKVSKADPAKTAEGSVAVEESPQPAALKHREAFSRAETDRKVLALTFITGPHGKYTTEILAELKSRKVKATFFVVGESVERYPQVVTAIVTDGHEIGNNSMTHRRLDKLDDDALLGEIKDCNDAVLKASGINPRLLRAPYGMILPRQRDLPRDRLGLRVVSWSSDPGDWKCPGARVVADRILAAAKPGGIILLHDLHKPTVESTRLAVDGLIEKGYEFATVSERIALDAEGRK